MNKETTLKRIKENGRSCTLLKECSLKDLPIIGLTCTDRNGALHIQQKVNLHEFTKQLAKLNDGEIFVIGRDEDCDLRPGYKLWLELTLKDGLTEKSAEKSYMNVLRTISRIHCFVEKKGKKYFVYDCSLAGTIIVPTPGFWTRIFRKS